MLHDFDSPASPVPAHADVCIIGAGAAGILLATELAKARRRVILLEGGGRQQEQRSQDIYRSEITGLPYAGIHNGRFRTYGGTTTQWGGQILELDDFDFEPRQHVTGTGWPFPKSFLTGYYERALHFEGLRRVERQDSRVWAALNLTSPDLGPEFFMQYSRWCPERNFAELHSRALTESRSLTVYFHANFVGFVLNDPKTAIQAVKVRSFTGREESFTADRFILCTGGIESIRLLLQPLAEGAAPWQASGLLGRHYQDHISLNGIPIKDIRLQPAHRYFGYVTVDGFRYHNKVRLSLAEQKAHETLNVAGTINPFRKENKARDKAFLTLRQMIRKRKLSSLSETARTAWYLPGITTGWLAYRFRDEAASWERTMLTLHCEQSPTSGSAVTLSEERDEFGLLRTRLDWEIGTHEIHSMRTYLRLATSACERGGFARIETPRGFFEDDAVVRAMCGDSNHHMGGTRMSSSPLNGIVDADLKLHGIANGYVCSSSVFPSSGFSNPTHTVLALAMRLSDHIAQRNQPAVSVPSRREPVVTELNASVESTRLVTLPGGSKLVPQLGFGCAYLLGPGLDAAKSRRLLDAAYDAGILHFDVARLYGQGKTEGLLFDFLRRHPKATVTTKYGVIPPNSSQRALAALQRRVPGLRFLTTILGSNDKARFDAAEAKESLELSLRLLGRNQVELFLLHEPDVNDLVDDDLFAFLDEQRTAGRIGDFGIGGEYYRMQDLYREKHRYARVMQFEFSILGPMLDLPETYRIHYRTFAKPAEALAKLFDRQPDLARRWSEIVNAELQEPQVLARLLLKASLDEHPKSLTLFSTRQEAHIFDNVEVATNMSLVEPARRLVALLREDDFSLGRDLYGR
jgi:choline dehydrogenase-like flavoprotein/diketogulonate reductase-like aldo/keto reductase